MARRRSTTTAIGGNLDSMLDTLMNVVGILIIVLVAVQLSSQEAATRIASAVRHVDPHEVARLEQTAEAARHKAAAAAQALRAQRDAVTNPQAELSRLQAELQIEEDLARTAVERATSLEKERAAKQAALQKDSQKKETERRQREKDYAATVARVSALREELETLPVLEAPPVKEVRLPDPRPAPPNVTEIHVLCREERIWIVDIPALQEKPKKRAEFVVRSKKLDPDNDTWIPDGKTFLDEFNKSPIKEGGFEMTLEALNGRWPRLVLTRMKGRGELADDALKASGDYARTLRRLAPETHILRFFVWPDSFETYLRARELASERGFAAGWEPMTAPDEHRIPLGKYGIGEKPPPKPSDPNAKPPPPKNVLD